MPLASSEVGLYEKIVSLCSPRHGAHLERWGCPAIWAAGSAIWAAGSAIWDTTAGSADG
jgi:hypothetical protein